MIREVVKIVNLSRGSTLIDSGVMPMGLLYKMSASTFQSAQFVEQPNHSVEQKSSSPCLSCQGSAVMAEDTPIVAIHLFLSLSLWRRSHQSSHPEEKRHATETVDTS
ncbi:hypothetical protein ACTXT7_015994 [Hymenolepis weldensis]